MNSDSGKVIKAVKFAADKHRKQRRKNEDATPYINHPIEVASLLIDAGVNDLASIQAAILHDTIEDTETTREELENLFGREVSDLVSEMTDDKNLPKEKRKLMQIEHAPQLSDKAGRIKLSDKIANITDVIRNPPKGWDVKRRSEYLDWAEKVVKGVRGTDQYLEKLFDERIKEGRKKLNDPG